MDELLNKQLQANILNYKNSLARIVDKYSKLQYQDGGLEVDLNRTKTQKLERYIDLSRAELTKLESKSLTDLREETLRAQSLTTDSQLDFMHQDGEADETCVSSVSATQFSVENDGMARSDVTQLTVSSLGESHRNHFEMELQPEDQDEELEMSLRSHGSSLAELYPSMISRIERARHRQNVSEAANSVLRRYRRWREQSNKSYLSNTFVVPQRHMESNSRNMTSQTLLRENSPVKSQFVRAEANRRSPLLVVTNLQDLQAQQQSPGRVRGTLRREQHQPVLVMDFSDLSETSKPKEISLNETFTVSELSPPDVSQLEEQPSTYVVSPSRHWYSSAKASSDLSLRSRRLFLPAHSPQTDECSMYVSETTGFKDRPDIYGSPVRQSPLKARMMTSLSRSPLALSRSPKAHFVESFSRELPRPRLRSTSLSSPPQKPVVPLRMHYPQDSRHSLQPQLRSPQSAVAAEGRHSLRRHLSFDSSLPSTHVSYSPKKVDEDFVKLYHKFVCQNRSSFFNVPPCRYCGRGSEARRSHSSSALAALALSPHRSVLRKRHRELSLDRYPQSKRFRDEYSASSPGSIRQRNEMLRRRLCPPEYEQPHNGPSYSPSKHSMVHRFSTQQRSADAQQETWMSQGHHRSAADFSGLGGSFESRMANGFSPRKW